MPARKKVAIVIPAYKTEPNAFEKISLSRCREVYPHIDRYLAVPENLDISVYTDLDPGLKPVYFDSKFFKDVYAYSLLCRKSSFYSPFLDYKYILLHQPDSFIFKNNLEEWCDKNYDYIGAPWIEPAWLPQFAKDIRIPFFTKIFRNVGNGGLSIRNTKKMYYASMLLWPVASRIRFNEDIWWSNFASRIIPFFRIPAQMEALQFAFDAKPDRCYELNGKQLPFGCHAWEKNLDFWRPFFKESGYNI